MSMIPSSVGRVPNMLSSQLALTNITRTNIALLRVQEQLATGKAINRVSDDAVRSAAVLELTNRIDRSKQRLRNIEHAKASIDILDKALSEAGDLAQEGKSIALQEIGFPSSAEQRQGQAVVVQSLLSNLFNTGNRTGVAGFVFGGTTPEVQPFVEENGGYRYVGQGNGLVTDIGLASDVPITIGGGRALGSTSKRVQGFVDLDPDLTMETRLVDIPGARGPGIAKGSIEVSINSGTRLTVDLSGADTVRDVADSITAVIRKYESDEGVTVLGPSGVSVSGEHFTIDVAAASGGPANSVEFFDVGNGTTATDLGLATSAGFSFTAASSGGVDLAPKLTWRTPITALAGVTGPLGSIKISNGSKSATIDLSEAQTLEDLKSAIESAKLSIRVVINKDGTGIDVVNELAAGERGAMSIAEVSGSGLTATRLGIRSFTGSTKLEDFNFGRGVKIIDGATDPTTGEPSPELDVDFTITLGDSQATKISIDLHQGDMRNVQGVLDAMNTQIADQLAAAGLPPGSLVAQISDGSNGIQLVQDSTFGSAITVEGRNNSPAADHLGLTSGTYDPASATFAGQDRAKVRVDGLFSDLLDLRNSLESNDTLGIGFAEQNLAKSIDHAAQARGVVGGYAKRVETAQVHEEDRNILDLKVRSQMQDLDYAEAATRFTLLNTQMQAGLQAAARSTQLSLLDFLG